MVENAGKICVVRFPRLLVPLVVKWKIVVGL
jgi:hypothetical protein